MKNFIVQTTCVCIQRPYYKMSRYSLKSPNLFPLPKYRPLNILTLPLRACQQILCLQYVFGVYLYLVFICKSLILKQWVQFNSSDFKRVLCVVLICGVNTKLFYACHYRCFLFVSCKMCSPKHICRSYQRLIPSLPFFF